jgi:hypothetical protein
MGNLMAGNPDPAVSYNGPQPRKPEFPPGTIDMNWCFKPQLALLTVLFAGVALLCQVPAAQEPKDIAAPSAPPQAAAPQQKPADIYREAMHPLDVVRSSLDNWSDAELQALAVGIHRAQAACVQAKPEDFSGDDLYDYAHLCSFGQLWPNADTAAAAYIAGGAETFRAQAYALRISAQVHQNDAESAVKTAEEMLRTQPYDAEVAYALHYLEDDLDQAWNPLALQLAQEEHPKLLKALQTGLSLKALHSPAELGVGRLFDAGMRLASLLRFTGNEAAAELTASETQTGGRAGIWGAARRPGRDCRRQRTLRPAGSSTAAIPGEACPTLCGSRLAHPHQSCKGGCVRNLSRLVRAMPPHDEESQ